MSNMTKAEARRLVSMVTLGVAELEEEKVTH